MPECVKTWRDTSSLRTVAEVQKDLLAIYRGKLAEQFVAQEMLATGCDPLFYWSRESRASNAEVDYLVVRDGKIYPVEVKSGAAGALRSLHLMLSVSFYNRKTICF